MKLDEILEGHTPAKFKWDDPVDLLDVRGKDDRDWLGRKRPLKTRISRMMLQDILESRTKVHTKKIATGLTRREALKAAPWKSNYGDCRGFHYNPKTGIATWI